MTRDEYSALLDIALMMAEMLEAKIDQMSEQLAQIAAQKQAQ